VAAALLALSVILLLISGLDPQTAADPAKALPLIAQHAGRWAGMNIGFVLSAAVSILFAAGLSSRLRDKAPTRSITLLYLAVIGLAGFALSGLVQWQGGGHLAAYRATDQVAASHAWVALTAVVQGLGALGNGFTGVAEVIAGWAITDTGALPATVGSLAIVTGVVTVLQIFSATPVLFFASIILTVAWLAWTGMELRGPHAAQRTVG
jgi:hypothetical protein